MTTSQAIETLLERAERDPTDTALRAVLADALVEAGDPRGELAAVQSARAALDELVAAVHEKYAAKAYGATDKRVHLVTDSGFVDSIVVSIDDGEYKKKQSAAGILEKLLGRRAGRVVGSVELRLSDKTPPKVVKDLAATLALLAEHAPLVRTLVLSPCATNRKPIDLELGPMLAKLSLTSLGLTPSQKTLKSVLAQTLPGVTHLELDAMYDDAIKPGDLKRLFETKTFPNLVSIRPRFSEDALLKLMDSPLAAQLKVVDFTSGSLDDTIGKKLVASKRRLGKLEQLVIDPEHLSIDTCRQLRGFCTEVRGLPAESELAWAEEQVERMRREETDRYEELSE